MKKDYKKETVREKKAHTKNLGKYLNYLQSNEFFGVFHTNTDVKSFTLAVNVVVNFVYVIHVRHGVTETETEAYVAQGKCGCWLDADADISISMTTILTIINKFVRCI